MVELREDGALDGVENMRRDRELFAEVESGSLDRPILRFFDWAEPTVSVGYHQRDDELDLQRLRRDGIACVRRPTGGGAIWHQNGVTFAFVAEWPGRTRQVKKAYSDVADVLARAFRALGVAAATGVGSGRGHVACFAAAEAHELHVDGRKLVGSAMRAGRCGFLLHGSIPGGPAHLRIGGYLKAPVDLAARSTHLAALGFRPQDLPRLRTAIHEELERWIRGDLALQASTGG